MLATLLKTLWIAWNWLELAVFTLLIYLLAWMPRSLIRSFYHKLFRVWCSMFVRALSVDLRLHQKNSKPLPKQFILIANHPSAFEDVGIPALFNVHPLAKAGVRKWWFAGRINVAAGTVFVKRSDRDSRRQAVESLIEVLEQGHSIALFPEGGCFGRRLRETFHAGAFDISIRTGIPLLPVFIHYEAQEVFEWMDPATLPHKIWHIVTSPNDKANYYVYDAIYPEGQTNKFVFAESVRQKFLKWQEEYLE